MKSNKRFVLFLFAFVFFLAYFTSLSPVYNNIEGLDGKPNPIFYGEASLLLLLAALGCKAALNSNIESLQNGRMRNIVLSMVDVLAALCVVTAIAGLAFSLYPGNMPYDRLCAVAKLVLCTGFAAMWFSCGMSGADWFCIFGCVLVFVGSIAVFVLAQGWRIYNVALDMAQNVEPQEIPYAIIFCSVHLFYVLSILLAQINLCWDAVKVLAKLKQDVRPIGKLI